LDYWKKLFWTAIQGVNITIKYARAPDLIGGFLEIIFPRQRIFNAHDEAAMAPG
jgi:hypothetical protein